MAEERLVGKLTVGHSVILPLITILTCSSMALSLAPVNATETPRNSSVEEYSSERIMNGTTELENITVTICEDLQCPEALPLFCRCDEDCVVYKDCCRNGKDFSSRQFSRDDGAKPQNRLQCVGTSFEYVDDTTGSSGTSFTLETGYYMVGECMRGVQNASLVERCHDPTDVLRNRLDSWYQYADHVPVLDLTTQKTYKNVHCALCNAVRYRNMRFWQLVASESCDFNGSPDECDLVEFQAVYPSDVESLRRCTVTEEASCPATADDKATRTLCESYQTLYPLNGTIYRNPHCAICNNEEFFRKNVYFCLNGLPSLTDGLFQGGRLPQVIPFHFSFGEPDNDTVVFCPEGLSYNQTSETCELSANSTEITLDLCLEKKIDAATVAVTLSANVTVAQSMNDGLSNLTELLSPTPVGTSPCNAVDATEIFSPGAHEDCVSIEVTINTSLEDVDRLRGQGLRIIRMELTTVCTELVASSPSSYSSLGTFNTSNVTLYTFQFTHYAIVRSKNRVHSDVVAAVTLRNLAANRSDVLSYKDTTYAISLHTISEENLLCPYTVLSQNEYHLEERNKSLRSKFLEDEIPLDDFLILSNGDLRICSHWIREETPPYTKFLLFVYIILTAMSLICLSMTFLIYCLFKELRNLPGLIAMNFVAALFFAQLILIPSYISPENSLLCTAISMAGHFLWLAVFLWMTIIAYDVTRTFGTSSATGHIKSGRKRLAKYMLIGWLMPAVFVAVCFVIRTWTSLKNVFAYGEKKNCWLTPGMANFLLFGVPASICLCCNFIMFFIAVRGLWKAKKHTKMAKKMTTSNIVKEQLLLSLKISILIGLSWIWAFLHSHFRQVVAFLFIHTFLNSLQGTFVFLVYVCNRRVKSMWKGKFKRSYVQKQGRNASSDTTKRSNETASTSLSDGERNTRKDGKSILLEEKTIKG